MSSMEMPSVSFLEDSQQDILNKALSMRGLSAVDIPDDPTAFAVFLKDKLHLDPEAWYNLPESVSVIPLPGGLERQILPFGDWTLNIWTLETPEGLVVIDTGLTPEQLRQATGGTHPAAILITHLHRDHTGGLGTFPGVPVYGPVPGTGYTNEGKRKLSIAGLDWETFNLAGHTPDGIGWSTAYKGKSIFFPGDSIFCGSIGKCPENGAIAIENILHAIRKLPGDTLLCPGHGPATDITREWAMNPFLVPFTS